MNDTEQSTAARLRAGLGYAGAAIPDGPGWHEPDRRRRWRDLAACFREIGNEAAACCCDEAAESLRRVH